VSRVDGLPGLTGSGKIIAALDAGYTVMERHTPTELAYLEYQDTFGV
jgi:hypothetical protein